MKDKFPLVKALIVWAVIMGTETLHGIARELWLKPRVGDFQARQIAVFTGAALILTITFVFVRWFNASRTGQLILIGLLWLGLTLTFEFALGRFVLGFSWERLLADYNLRQGGLLGLGMLMLIFSPYLAGRLRGLV